MADSAQVPELQQDNRRVVLGLGRGVLELKMHEEESKYTEVVANKSDGSQDARRWSPAILNEPLQQ